MTPATRSLWVNGSLVLVAVALTFVVLSTSGTLTSGERTRREGHLLVDYRKELVQNLSVSAGGQSIHLRRSADPQVWMLGGPDVGEGEVATVDRLLKALSFATWLRRVPEKDVDRAAFGLEAPLWALEFDQGASLRQLRLGGDAKSPKGAHYLEVTGASSSDAGVFVVGAATAHELQVEPAQFRVRLLVPYAATAIESLSLERGGQTHTIKRGRGFWRFDGSARNSRIDRFVADRLFLGLSRMQAETFLALPAAERIQSDAAAELLTLIVTTDKVAATYRIGPKCPEKPELFVVSRRQPEPVAACAPAADLLQLAESPPAWSDRKLFQARPDEVEEVRSVEAGRRLEFARREDGFIMRKPTNGSIEAEVGNTRVAELTALVGSPVSSDRWRTATVLGQVTLQRLAAGTQPPLEERIDWGELDGRLLVRREADHALFEVSRDARALFAPNSLLVRSRALLELKPDQIRRIVIGSPAQEVEQVRPGLFELRRPVGYEADGGLVGGLFAELSRLTAERWIAESATLAMDFNERNFVRIEQIDGGRLEVQIGRRAPGGGYFAKLRRGPEVFTISAALVQQLKTLLIDRSVFQLDLSQVETLTLRAANGKSLRFTDVSGGLVLERGSSGISDGTAGELLAGLSELQAEAALSVETPEKHQGFAHPVLEVAIEGRTKSQPSVSPPPPDEKIRWQIGAGDTYRGVSMYYARVLGNRAIFAVSRARVRRILDLLE